MCIAIYKPANVTIERKRLEAAHKANPDGWGLMWFDGGIRTDKGITSFQTFYKSYKDLANEEVVIHFRTASSGHISVDKTHPFFVNDKLAFVQNGNLFEYQDYFPNVAANDETDIQRFNWEVLQGLPNLFLDDDDISRVLTDYLRGNLSRMIFMDSYGEAKIICEDLGIWYDGAWYSNGGLTDYTGYGFSGAYYYNPGDIRHKGGIISPMQFSEERRQEWHQCPCCLGYYRHVTVTANGQSICDSCSRWNDLLLYVES